MDIMDMANAVEAHLARCEMQQAVIGRITFRALYEPGQDCHLPLLHVVDRGPTPEEVVAALGAAGLTAEAVSCFPHGGMDVQLTCTVNADYWLRQEPVTGVNTPAGQRSIPMPCPRNLRSALAVRRLFP